MIFDQRQQSGREGGRERRFEKQSQQAQRISLRRSLGLTNPGSVKQLANAEKQSATCLGQTPNIPEQNATGCSYCVDNR